MGDGKDVGTKVKFLFITTKDNGEQEKFYRKPSNKTCAECGNVVEEVSGPQFERNTGYEFGRYINEECPSYEFWCGLMKYLHDVDVDLRRFYSSTKITSRKEPA